MKIEEKFLPIGTVVKLKDAKKQLMIVSFNVSTQGDVYDKNGKINSKGLKFDYAACGYPEGIIRSDRMFAFNHDQIEEIVFKGYTTSESKEISEFLNKLIEEDKKQKNKKNDEKGN